LTCSYLIIKRVCDIMPGQWVRFAGDDKWQAFAG
jgi:hypothetical protein